MLRGTGHSVRIAANSTPGLTARTHFSNKPNLTTATLFTLLSMTADMTHTVRALGLCSGGLDSILSALVLRRQAVAVEWISFETPFFSAQKARRAAERHDIGLHVMDITADYLRMLKAPPAGFGRNVNPCMDCHCLMFRKAGEFMQRNGFDFLFSGEVLGQRPMSQNGNSLRYVAKHSGFKDYILRPLSARRLTETTMEQQGLVDRSRLLDLSGRSRKPQMALAAEWGVTEYPSPAGGCRLTDPEYTKRLRDLFDHNVVLNERSLGLLTYGRHMRLSPDHKIVIGRHQQENDEIAKHCDPSRDLIIKARGYPGPLVIMPGGGPKEMVFLAGGICAGYSKAPVEHPVQVQVAAGSHTETITVLTILPSEAKRFLIN
jgi:tRNA-uridine 2-sulfurtransferase